MAQTDKLVKGGNGIVRTPPPFDREQRRGLARMSDEGRTAVVDARPEAQFGITPVLPEDSKLAIAAVIDEYGIRPPRGWLLIKVVPPAERIGLVLIPDAAQNPPEIGIVIAVGEGTFQGGQLVPPEVKIGDHVTFPKFCGMEVKVAGENLTQMREDEILLIATRPGGRG